MILYRNHISGFTDDCHPATLPGFALAAMRCFATSLFLCVLLGCSHAPIVSWDFEKADDGKSMVNGKVWLLVDGKRHLVEDRPLVDKFEVLNRSEYARNDIPKDALLACSGEGPVGWEAMYVRADAKHVMVFRRWLGEAVPGIPPYSLFKTIQRDGSI